MIYILNTFAVPINFVKHEEAIIKIEKIELEQAKKLLSNNKFVSAVGHESTARLLSELFGVHIPTNRIEVSLEEGDISLHFVLLRRLAEGQILNYQELAKTGFNLLLSKVLTVK
jgi:hypothetical protein